MKKDFKVRHIVFDADQFLRLAEEIEEDELVIWLGEVEVKWVAQRYPSSICIRSRMRVEPEIIEQLEREIPLLRKAAADKALATLRKIIEESEPV